MLHTDYIVRGIMEKKETLGPLEFERYMRNVIDEERRQAEENLRDRLAMAALTGLVERLPDEHTENADEREKKMIARVSRLAYTVADQMLLKRRPVDKTS